MVWDTSKDGCFAGLRQIDVYDSTGKFLCDKILSVINEKKITKWISSCDVKSKKFVIGYTGNTGPDVQHTSFLYLTNSQKFLPNGNVTNETKYNVTSANFTQICIYFAVRLSVEMTWYNDRDQFLFPNDDWQRDKEFQFDCLIYTLFHGQNRISQESGINHWIPFTEKQVGCKKTFKSDFMSKFLNGKIEFAIDDSDGLFANVAMAKSAKMVLSPEARGVYDAGLALWRYYHSQGDAMPDASFYDIRKHFQRVTNDRMNNNSSDVKYNELIADLRAKMRLLAKRIEPKVYEYGFLK